MNLSSFILKTKFDEFSSTALSITVYFDIYLSKITESSRLENCKQMKKVTFGLTPLKILHAEIKPCGKKFIIIRIIGSIFKILYAEIKSYGKKFIIICIVGSIFKILFDS